MGGIYQEGGRPVLSELVIPNAIQNVKPTTYDPWQSLDGLKPPSTLDKQDH